MIKRNIKFSGDGTGFYFNGNFSLLKKLCDKRNTVLVTDENIYGFHAKKFSGWNTIIVKAGEEFKVQETADAIIEQLISMQADRTSTIVGIGGGVITDLSGYIASIYMRGLRFGFVPTTILGMVDASVGGKNGVDVGEYKNMVGTVRQPSFILHDMDFLRTLPLPEWSNGFAEVVKHACILDKQMFRQLEKTDLDYYRKNKTELATLIQKNVLLKARIVQLDEFEKGDRKKLNFGHTVGHAIETHYNLMHGEAVSVGMVVACRVSEQLKGFRDTERVIRVLENFRLPVSGDFKTSKIFPILEMDKKRQNKNIQYVLLEEIGHATIQPIPLSTLKKILEKVS